MAFLVGVAVSSLIWKINLPGILALGLVLYSVRYYLLGWNKLIWIFICALAGIFLMLLNLQNYLQYNNLLSPVIAEITAFPELRGREKQVFLKTVSENGISDGISLMANLNFYDQVEPGDFLRLEGQLTPVNRLMLLKRDDLFRKKINYIVNDLDFEIVDKNNLNFLGHIYRWKSFLLNRVNSFFDKNTATLVAGVLMGERSDIDQNILENFKTTGLTHILAVSGFNITIIINFVVILMAGLNKWLRMLMISLLIFLFVIFTGGSASVVRAGVMGVLALMIKTTGRNSSLIKILLISTVLIVCFDPLVLNFDISFQLSCGATLGLLMFADRIDNLGLREGWFQEFLLTSLWQTIAAQLIVLPIIFVNFGQISLISPLANLLVAPLVPLMMIFGAITILIGILWPQIGQFIGLFAGLIGQVLLSITETISKIPLASIQIGEEQYWLAILYWYLLFKFFHKQKLVPGFC